MEATLEALADAGLPTGTALSAWTALVAFTNGHAGYQIHGHLLGGTRDALAIDDDRFPHVARAIAGDFDWDHAFREGLGGLIDAIQHAATLRREPSLPTGVRERTSSRGPTP